MSDKYAVPNKLPAKQVSILAQRKKRILHDKSLVEQRRRSRIKRYTKKKRNFTRAETFIMDYIKAERLQRRTRKLLISKNVFKNDNNSSSSSDKNKKSEIANDKILVVTRFCGRHISDPTVTRILKSLRMYVRHKTIILRNTEENRLLLKIIEPYVAYGYPTITTIRELVFKKGFALIDGKKKAITSNTMIEEQLGNHGIICLEDIIHEIFNVGPNFDTVIRFLCPFVLRAPKNGWKRPIGKCYEKGGEYGNRKEAINELIARCL